MLEHGMWLQHLPVPCSLLFGDLQPTDLVKATFAPFGGLVAVYPAVQSAAVTPVPELSYITITNPSGAHRVTIPLQQVLGTNRGWLVSVGWTDPEILVCTTSTGHCLAFTPLGAPFAPASLVHLPHVGVL
jgi:hypothetical protein